MRIEAERDMFDPNTDMQIEGNEREDGSLDLVSSGLENVGRSELAMFGVPPGQARDAAMVINVVAEYVAETPVASGERIGIEYPMASLGVRLFDVEHGEKKGFLGFGKKPRVVQVIADAHADEPGLARTAIATMLGLKASMLAENDDAASGAQVLLDSIEQWPGEPGVSGEPDNFIYNWQNARNYLKLSQMWPEFDRQVDFLEKALERSRMVHWQVFGMLPEELEVWTAENVREAAADLLNRWEQLAEVGPDLDSMAPEGNTIAVTPLMRRTDDGAAFVMSLMPKAFTEQFVRHDHPILDEIDADWLTKILMHHVERPAVLAVAVHDSRDAVDDPNAPSAWPFEEQPPHAELGTILGGVFTHTLRLGAVTDLATVERSLLAPGEADDAVEAALEAATEFEQRAFFEALSAIG